MGKEVSFTTFNEMFLPTEQEPPTPPTAAEITTVDKAGNTVSVTFTSNYSNEVEIEISDDNVTYAFYGKNTVDVTPPPPWSGETDVTDFDPTLTASAGKWIRAKVIDQDTEPVYSEAVQIAP